MGKINGLHHVAIATGNMKEQLQFFSDVLGMRLQGLYWMHGVEGAWHAFMEMGERNLPLPLCRAMKKLILNTALRMPAAGRATARLVACNICVECGHAGRFAGHA